ncbi:MAG: hypothetical protein GF401_09095 [Chitinivibrionales bacterium]|nr:hypothetical protein [Chitinivibrionales bacterium]
MTDKNGYLPSDTLQDESDDDIVEAIEQTRTRLERTLTSLRFRVHRLIITVKIVVAVVIAIIFLIKIFRLWSGKRRHSHHKMKR